MCIYDGQKEMFPGVRDQYKSGEKPRSRVPRLGARWCKPPTWQHFARRGRRGGRQPVVGPGWAHFASLSSFFFFFLYSEIFYTKSFKEVYLKKRIENGLYI